MRKTAVAGLALLAATCGPGVPPCTTCINVQGTYEVTVDARGADRSTCEMLTISGWTTELELYQKGSELELPGFFGSEGISGTLMADDSARFGPLRIPVTNTAPVAYANVTLSGRFTGEEAERRFDGALVASTYFENTACSVSTQVRMAKKKSAP